MVLGSGSVPELVGPARTARWVALVCLAAIAAVLAVRGRGSGGSRTLGLVLGMGAWFCALGIVSTAWSVDPRLTFGRAGSFALLFVAAGGLAIAARSRPAVSTRVLQGILAATVAATIAGLLLILYSHADAIQPPSHEQPSRLKGLGANPDTMAMLAAVATPIALWTLLHARSRRERAFALASWLLLVGSLAGYGSRGGFLAATVGMLAVSLLLNASWRKRLVLALTVCVAMAGATAAGTQIVKPLPYTPTPGKLPGGKVGVPTAGQALGGNGPTYTGRLADELYRFYYGRRSLFASSGRLEAWYTAVQEGNARPVLGFGFGTEERVFVDRIYSFDGGHVENSFIGMYLQLGAIGLLSLVALLGGVCVAIVAGTRRADLRSPSLAFAGVVGAGLVLMLVQSYAYSVGNVATVAFWTASLVAAAANPATVRQGARARVSQEEGLVAAG